MIVTAREIVNKAKEFLGIKESPPNSNKVIFSKDYGLIGAWCMMFVWDVFRMCEASEMFYDGKKCASCTTLMNWAKSKGKFINNGKYQEGDVVFYNFNSDPKSEHTGIVVSDEGSYIMAVEGNTSPDDKGSQADGGMVCLKKRKKSLILGVYRPDYAQPKYEYSQKQFILDVQKALGVKQTGACSENGNTIKATITINTSKNKKHKVVIPLQKRLKALGFYTMEIDGSYGNGMASAVNAYAKTIGGKGLDGEITAKGRTWKGLLGIL